MTDLFTNFTEKIIFPETSDETYRILDRLSKQSATDVARCILNVLEKEKNGAVYVIEGKRIVPIDMKPYWTGKEPALWAEDVTNNTDSTILTNDVEFKEMSRVVFNKQASIL